MDKTRSKTIIKSGYIFILTNFLLAIFNFVIGLMSNSLAIASDAVHSLADSVSGLLIIVSEKFAAHKKLSNYRAKIERWTTIIIALVIVAIGLEISIASVKNFFSPEEIDYSAPTIVILIASIITKYLLANYLRRTGKIIKSTVLIASSAETMNDTWISVAVLISVIIYLVFGVNIGAYISLFISLIIIKVGIEFIFPHFSSHHHHFEQNTNHDHYGK